MLFKCINIKGLYYIMFEFIVKKDEMNGENRRIRVRKLGEFQHENKHSFKKMAFSWNYVLIMLAKFKAVVYITA